MLGQWTHLFESHVLERGYDIFYHGHVKRISQNIFQVRGKKVYQVKVAFEHDEPVHLSCQCSYAKEGRLCKHEAAVLLYLENAQMPLKTYFAGPEEIVSMMDDEMKNKILTKLLAKDYQLLIEANEFFADVEDTYSSLSLILNGIFMDYGYHNDDETFEKEILEFIHVHILPLTDQKISFALLKHLLSRLVIREEHRFYQAEQEAMDCLDLLVNNDTIRDDIFHFLMADPSIEIYLDFLYDHFRKEPYLKIKRQLIDRLIEKTSAFDAWAKDYYLEYYILKKLQVLYDQKDHQAIEILTKTFWHYPKVREFWIEESIITKKYLRAIELIQKSKMLAEQQPALQLKYDRQLLDLYELCHHPLYFSALEEMLFKTDPGDFDDYLRFKKICPAKKWADYQMKLVQVPMKTDRLLEILLAEKKYKDLFELAIREENLYFLEKNRAVLLHDCPELLADSYVQISLQLSKTAGCKEDYQRISSLLKKLTLITDGKEKAALVKRQLKKLYPKKRALHEALDKI